MRTLLTILFVAIALPAAAASVPLGGGYGAIDAPRDIDAVGLGHQFCAARLLDDMSRIAGYLAPKLETLLAAARHEIQWQSIDLRPTGCDIALVNGVDDTAGVMLLVNYAADETRWSDTLQVVRTPDSWRIDNVFYQGGGNLRFRLFESK